MDRREEGHKGRKDTTGGRTRREEGHKEREDTKGGRTRGKDTKGGRRGRGTLDCPNKGEEITEE